MVTKQLFVRFTSLRFYVIDNCCECQYYIQVEVFVLHMQQGGQTYELIHIYIYDENRNMSFEMVRSNKQEMCFDFYHIENVIVISL